MKEETEHPTVDVAAVANSVSTPGISLKPPLPPEASPLLTPAALTALFKFLACNALPDLMEWDIDKIVGGCLFVPLAALDFNRSVISFATRLSFLLDVLYQ